MSSAPDLNPAVYALVRGFIHLCLQVFYQQIRVVGLENVPREGAKPVIFAGNHPNSLLDPALVICSCGRYVHFAARDALFESRPLRVIFGALGVVPIARRSDHPDAALDNSDAFSALHDVLSRGRAMGIFPEGLSHESASLSKLKTGAARIGLGLVAERPEVDALVVPVGLTYLHRRRFRSRVLVQYGQPIRLAEWISRYQEDPREAARELTAEIDKGLRGLTINAPDWETVRVLDGVRRLYQPPRIPLEHRVELARRFNEVYPKVKDQPEVVILYQRVERYLDHLDAMGISDSDLDEDASFQSRRVRAARNLLLALVWMPLALPGFVIFAPVGRMVSWAGYTLAPRKDVIATTKFILGVVSVVAAYGSLVVLTALFTGPLWGLLLLFFLPLSAIATLRVLERGVALKELLKSGLQSLLLSREIERLKGERRFLEAEVIRAVERLMPPEMERLYQRTVEAEP